MIIVVFFSFITSLLIAIQDPIIQNFAIRIAGGYLSSKTGADVKIGRLTIAPDFSVHLEKFSIKDLKNNELLNVNELIVKPVIHDIVQGEINIDHVELNDAQANLIAYKGEDELNLQFLLDFFSSDKEKENNDHPFPVKVKKILVNDLDFQYWNQDKDTLTMSENGLLNPNHIVIDDIHLDMEQLNILGDSITATVHRLSAIEQSGFTINHLETKVNVSSSGILLDSLNFETAQSKLNLDLHMLYSGYPALGSFIDSVTFDSNIRTSDLMLSDLGPFSKVMYDMPDRIQLQGLMNGPVKRFQLRQLKARIGEMTRFEGDITLEPLDFLRGNQVLNIKQLNYSYNDLVNFRIPGPSKTIPLPSMLKSLGQGSIKGSFSGSMEKFIADLNITSEIGSVKADISKHRNEWDYDIYEGFVEAKQLDIGTLASISNTIETINLDADFICRIGKDNDIDLDIDGNAYQAILLGNSIDEISLNGNLHKNQFNGKISIDDDELDLDFKGRFDFNDPKSLGGDFQADINHADLNKLNIIKDDPDASLSASITADMNSINNFNETEGKLNISNLVFENHQGSLVMDAFNATITNDNLMQKIIQLNCDFFDFEMAGKMDFTTMASAFKQYLNTYLTIPQWQEELASLEQAEKDLSQDFIVQMTMKNPKPLTQLFMPSLSIAKNTYINGTFTSRSQMLNLTLRSKYVNVNNIKINNIECKSQSSRRRSSTRLHIDNIILRDSTEKSPSVIGLDNFSIAGNLRNDSIMTDISWDDVSPDDHNKAIIRTSFVLHPSGDGQFNIYESGIILNDTLWSFNPTNSIVIDSSDIILSNVELVNNEQSVKLEGKVPFTVNDTLLASFNKFNLSTFNFILESLGMDLSGQVNGNAQVSNLKVDPSIFANLSIDSLTINKEVFGDAEISSVWDNEHESVNLDFGLINQQLKTLDLSGSFYPRKAKDYLDFNMNINDLNIGILNPFVQGIAHRVQGLGNGALHLGGELDSPQVNGSIRINDGGCMIDFLNTYYTFSPTIHVNDSLISITDLALTDTLGNAASVAGQITHDHFKDFHLNIRMLPNNFLAMASNASTSPSFYGTAIASGIIEVKGPLNDLDISVRARTNKGTVMTIPIGGNSEVTKHEFIVFVDHQEKSDEKEEAAVKVEEKQKSNFNIGLNLGVNSDAQIRIALPNGLGSMEARGDGNIRLGVNRNDLSLIGDYVISNGNLTLNIQDLIHRNFSLDPGSSISWAGDPVNGTINATGVYQTKASLASLGLADSTTMTNTNVKVECLVHLKDKLLNPEITFGIRLPNATEDLQQAVFSIIDTTNQSVVFTQTLYLLAFNSFNYGDSFDGMGLLTGQFSDYISRFVDDLDINFNYKAGSDINNEEMTIALRKQLFDDRLTIETNFGVIIPSNTYANNSTSVVGDVNLDYKITKDGRFSAQVFNRSNYNTMYYQYSYYKMAPYTQGIGLSYNKSFDRIKDIFKKQPAMTRPNRPFLDKNTNQNQNQDQDHEPSE